MRSFSAFTLATVVVLAVGCQRRSTSALASGLPPKLESTALLDAIALRLFDPESAELKGDAQVSGTSVDKLSLAATVRYHQDSVFWFSLRKFGFEGARGRVTADSVIALNRLKREVLRATPADLPAEAKLLPIEPTVANLTAAFAGQPIGEWQGATVAREPGRYLLTSSKYPGTTLIVDAQRQVPLTWMYRDGANYGRVDFDDFRAAGQGQLFPYQRTLAFSDEPGDTTRVELRFNSLSTEGGLSYPISVPPDYGQMKL